MMRESSLDEQDRGGGSMNLDLGRDNSFRMLQKDIGTHSLNLNPMFRRSSGAPSSRPISATSSNSNSNACSRNELDEDRNGVHNRTDRDNDNDNGNVTQEEEEKKDETLEDETAVVETTEEVTEKKADEKGEDDKDNDKEEDKKEDKKEGIKEDNEKEGLKEDVKDDKGEDKKDEGGNKEEEPAEREAAVSPSNISRQNIHRTAPASDSHQPRQDYLRHMTPTTPQNTTTAATPSSNTPAYAAPNPNSAANNTSTTSSRKAGTSWWERVVVQRSSYVVEDLVEQYTADSVFLQGETFPVAFMDRIEIETGDLLGSGTYSNVSQVKRLQLLPDFLTDHPEQLQLRKELYDAIPEAARAPDTSTDGEREDDAPVPAPTFQSTATTGYAIKHLKAELLQNSKLFEAAAADLIMEAKFLSRLSHPNILSLRGMALGGTSTFAATGLFDSYFLIVNELKETLIQRIHRWKVQGSTDQYRSHMVLHKLKIAAQVASALAYLHERRLVFRDLKPHNIGIREDGVIQLFDFGFCRELPSLESALLPGQVPSSNSGPRSSQGNASNGATSPELVPTNEEEDDERLYCMSGKGTLLYMAAEVLQSRCYNQKADVYSWSMVTYELMTLVKPFSVCSIEQHKKAVCGERGQRPPLHHLRWLPSGVKDLLEHSWRADVHARWHMKDVKETLEELILELENCRGSFSRDSFGSHANPTKGFFCQAGEMDDIMLDFTNTMQTRYEYIANTIFCRGNVADVADVGDSTAAVADSRVDTPKASEGGTQATVTDKKDPDKKPAVEKKALAQQGREERKDEATAAAAGSISTALFGETSQRLPLPETSEQFPMTSLAMHSVRLSAARNRHSTASSSYTASTRIAAAARERHSSAAMASSSFTPSTRLAAAARDRHASGFMSFTGSTRLAASERESHAMASMSFTGSTRLAASARDRSSSYSTSIRLASQSLDDARKQLRKSSMAKSGLEDTVEVAGESLESFGSQNQKDGNCELQTIKSEEGASESLESTVTQSQKDGNCELQTIKSEDDDAGASDSIPTEPEFFEKSGVLETIKSEEEENGLEDVATELPNVGKSTLRESANPQDDTHEKAFVVSTASV